MEKFIDQLSKWAIEKSTDTAFCSIEIEKETKITYEELLERSLITASHLADKNVSTPVLLIFNNSIEFLVAFCACQIAGVTAVPMFFPKNHRYFDRLDNIVEDSGAELILCEAQNLEKIEKGCSTFDTKVSCLGISSLDEKKVGAITQFRENELAFIQYTSGSTGAPKGVMVSQENIYHNEQLIQETFGCTEDSVILTWLPFYHDMGLIGNLLHTIYVGCTCVILNPIDVLQTPSLWLKSIDKYRATHSGGPNLIYDKCVERIKNEDLDQLDLSTWQVAYNGSEPIKKDTIDAFTNKFSRANFSVDAFKVCYGLAEATLIVSGGQPTYWGDDIGSGSICSGTSLLFYNEEDKTFNTTKGEICLAGKSISKGYWNRDNTPFFVEFNGQNYFRTGDVGTLNEGELVISGRIKEVIIINGKNFYPYDVENEICREIEEVDENGVVVSFIHEEFDQPLVFVELKRAFLKGNHNAIIRKIDRVVIDILGCEAYDIVLLSTRRLPRTSSGKLQRIRIKNEYVENLVTFLSSKKQSDSNSINRPLAEGIQKVNQDPTSYSAVENYLLLLLQDKLSLPAETVNSIKESSLMDLGISSLMAVQLVQQMEQDINVSIEVGELIKLNQFKAIQDYLMSLLWLASSGTTEEKGIVI